jgi:hypothetical protein
MDTIKFSTKGMCDFINVLKSLDNIRRHTSSVYNGKNISRLVFISHEAVIWPVLRSVHLDLV